MSGQWGTTTFACLTDKPQCLDTCLCFPCQASRQVRALEGASNELDPKWCVIAALCGVCTSFYIRSNVVKKYQIEETPLMVGVFSVCLAPCSSCQVHRELTLRNSWPGGMIFHKQPGDYTQMK
eukprot:TRINITY_DN2129_c0_g1_i18.p1 TRINITY_DN2129_c0_g1~~TRINITY_DN2129_c0_g1_i18.p1  ORF type:complete len:123 (+),score=37.45 TRINITY_DN2129_c0_g1_i18:209-577(+)